jgi:hypothetical protein
MYGNKQEDGVFVSLVFLKKYSINLLVIASFVLVVGCGGGSSLTSSAAPAPDPIVVTNNFVQLGEVFSGFISNTSEQVIVGVELVANQTYRVEMHPGDATTNAIRDTFIADVLDPRGGSLGLSDDDSGVEFTATLIFSPSETGTFYVVAGVPGQFSPTGNFTLLTTTLVVPEDDFSNALDDSNAINLWETQDGVIDTATDTDTISISLVSGTPVDITAYGNDNGLFPELGEIDILSFVDSNGDDIDPALFDRVEGFGNFIIEIKQLTFTPQFTGSYFLTVGSTSGVGAYSVSVAEQDKGIFGIRANEPFTYTGTPEIDAFFDSVNVEFFKGDNIISDRNGDGITTLTYSILNSNSQYSDAFQHPIASASKVNFRPADGVVLKTFLAAMEDLSRFSNIQFIEVPDNGVEAGNFRMGLSGLQVGGGGRFANGWSGFPRWGEIGEVWINPTQAALNIQGTSLLLEEFLVNRTLHEFTHNLGLAHFDRSPNFASDLDSALTGQEYSVMSRTDSGTIVSTAVGDLVPQTHMWFDIQAIQSAYGVNTAATAGSDTYSVDTTSRNFSTLWDFGGTDTLELIGNASTVINLTPGTWQDVGTIISYIDFESGSVVGTRTDTVFIAPDTMLENVTAGTGNDIITGNSADNNLNGNSGNDVIAGGAGNDTLSGGGGSDSFRFLTVLDGNDVISDFSIIDDVINLDDLLDASNIDPINRGVLLSEDSAGNTIINIDTESDGSINNPEFSITLVGVSLADFSADPIGNGLIIVNE